MSEQNQNKETEEEKDRRLNQETTIEKLKTPKHEIKKLKTLEELLRGVGVKSIVNNKCKSSNPLPFNPAPNGILLFLLIVRYC